MESQQPLTNGNANHNHNGDSPSAEPPASTFDPEIFKRYLLGLLPPVIGAKPSELESLFDDEFDERVRRFAADTGGVIYVVQSKEENEGMFKVSLCIYLADFWNRRLEYIV